MDFKLRFTDKEITPWGGMGVMKRMLDHLGFESALSSCGLPQPQSNRGYAAEQLIRQFMLAVWCGANRFEHAEVTRFDATLGKVFGFSKMANFKAIVRLFGKFNQALNGQVFGFLYRWLFGQVAIGDITLDLDSTVVTRYGIQEGAARGYNASKRGRLSHHPLMAFVSDLRMIANFWLRPGNSHTANNVIAFLDDTQDHLGDKHIGLLRADSGFCDDAFLRHLQSRSIPYIVALRLNQPLQRSLVQHGGWWALDTGIELTAYDYQAPSWQAPRRVIGIRQHIQQRPQAKGKTLSLFANDQVQGHWRYAALVTDLALPAQEVWRLYRGRADCENRIKELKYDFGADSFNAHSFWATEAALQTTMLAFNLMSLLRQAVLRSASSLPGQNVQHTLKTLRYKLFAQPAYLTHEGRKPVLILATALQRREWLQGIWDQAKTFDVPVLLPSNYCPKPSG